MVAARRPEPPAETTAAPLPAAEASPAGAEEAQTPPSPPTLEWLRPALIGVTLVLAAILLFTSLAGRVLWDDEAATALAAKAIMRTGGDTALVDYGNIVAYKDGNALVGFDNRVEPLLPAYATAASFEIFGMETWAARLPFALFGLGTYALLMLWARRESWQTIAVLALASLGNVSLLLYSRNCRYYAPTIFFSVALAYVYRKVRPGVGSACAFAALSIGLFTSNYLDYIAFYVCLVLDYLLWQRRQSPWNWRLLLCAFLPQILVNGVIGAIWNPLRTAHANDLAQSSLWDKFTLLGWQWRDANSCEMICLPLLMVALVFAVARRHTLLLRGYVVLAVYLVVLTVISPQIVSIAIFADVRYITPIIPLAIGLETVALCLLLKRWTLPLFAVAVVSFGTNFVSGWFMFNHLTRSTLVSYVQELINPPPSPYALTSGWIKEHVPEGSTVVVWPYYAIYPLMFYAPKPLYGWQFKWPPRPEYAGLPPIHFEGRVAPDYLVGFGPGLNKFAETLRGVDLHGERYIPVATVNLYWEEFDRPELRYHGFEQATRFDRDKDTVHIFKRTVMPGASGPQKDQADSFADPVR